MPKTNIDATPLHNAARRNASDTAQILLEHGAKINAKDEYGYTPLHQAIRQNDSDYSKTLIGIWGQYKHRR